VNDAANSIGDESTVPSSSTRCRRKRPTLAAVIPVAEGPLLVRAAVYPNNGQSLAELAETAAADLPPPQVAAASPTEPISSMRFTSSILERLASGRSGK
jgi:hypothetical protein